jgi:outer membrane protein OmpA-like peptidoglycan-associated protein/tetratricopeptide (TPR) repeat protein
LIKLYPQDSSNTIAIMKNKFIYIALLSIASLSTYAQKKDKSTRGNKEYQNYAYIDAAKTYERLYEKGYKSPDMLLKLGNSYYFNADLDKANKYYGELYDTNAEQEPEYYYRYSQTLRAAKDYTKADEMMVKFNALSGNDSRAQLFSKKRDYLAEIKKNSGRYKVENAAEMNSSYSDYGTSFMGTKVVFCSARDTGSMAKNKHTWTGQNFTNLYSIEDSKKDTQASKKDTDDSKKDTESGVQKFGDKLNSKYHEDTPVFTKDGKTIYFTRNNFSKKKRGYDGNKVTLLKIYKSKLGDDGKWSEAVALPFTSDSYQTAHPALSPDDKTMYFASDMPGTLGQSDLFSVSISDDGSFGTPVNLGNQINTEGRETYPFVSAKNELYFASDGQPGIGGLDIFVIKVPEAGGVFKNALNVGEEANSPKDDFAFIINTDTKKGFLSSNRDGGQGNDDIYKFLETKEIFREHAIYGKATDSSTKEPLPDTKITLLNEKFEKIFETVTDKDGNYEFPKLETDTKYYVRAEKDGSNITEMPIMTGPDTGRTEFNVELEKTVVPVKIGDDIADVFKINLIYFDLDKWNIRPDAEIDIAKVLDVMEKNPTMTIDIRSHTDSRQTFAYNEKLSDRRAKSTMAWLVNHGIAAERLTAKGYGETQLVNKCADDVPCTEEEHQLNRRSQFIITAL